MQHGITVSVASNITINKNADPTVEYTQQMMWFGLLILTHRDGCRENELFVPHLDQLIQKYQLYTYRVGNIIIQTS